VTTKGQSHRQSNIFERSWIAGEGGTKLSWHERPRIARGGASGHVSRAAGRKVRRESHSSKRVPCDAQPPTQGVEKLLSLARWGRGNTLWDSKKRAFFGLERPRETAVGRKPASSLRSRGGRPRRCARKKKTRERRKVQKEQFKTERYGETGLQRDNARQPQQSRLRAER